MKHTKTVASIMLFAGLLLSACGAGKPEPTPTQSLEQIQTAAVVTFAAGLTQTAILQPTATLTPSPIPTNTLLPTIPVSTGATATLAGGAVASCNKLVYVSDVTIPDNTAMAPGESFTKTWRVQNSGSCAWGVGFKFSLIGGDPMGAQAITLSQQVSPGAVYDISVPMTAPASGTGKITGTWRMSDASGAFFGDALTVVITLGGSGGGTATATAATATTGPTATTQPTATSTP